MKKLENTPQNYLIVSGATIGGLAAAGFLFANAGDKKLFAISGALLGTFILLGVFSWVIEPSKEEKDGF